MFAFVLSVGSLVTAKAQQNDAGVASPAAYVPDLTHQNEPLPDGVFSWDELIKTVEATNGQAMANFLFNFTNITTESVAIVDVHPSCGCTTVELPARPWLIPAGTGGQIKLNVNLAGKAGTLFKTASVSTEKGKKDLMLRINIAPPPAPRMLSDAERIAAMQLAKVDRQAVLKGDCASCHWKPEFAAQYGQQLFKSACAICHEAEHRAEMVPDLANLKVPTNEEFWRTWITFGKPGSLMPAFAQSQGGPMTDLQIASLAQYLVVTHPSRATNSVSQ